MATPSSILAWEIPWTEELQWATVHWVAKSWTRLKWLSTHSESLSSTVKVQTACILLKLPPLPFLLSCPCSPPSQQRVLLATLWRTWRLSDCHAM